VTQVPVSRGLSQEERPVPSPALVLLAEAMGTYILCFFGPGAVAVAVLVGGHAGLWQVASVWGFAIAIAIYAVGAISGGHLNPAVTLSMAVYRPWACPPRRVPVYVCGQVIGGVLAALTLLVLFEPTCRDFEARHVPPILRGQPGSQLSAMWFGEYFPNPAIYGTDEVAFSKVTPATAFAAEGIGTGILLFSIFALTDPRNRLSPSRYRLEPLFIGFTVSIIISIVGPLTQAGLNPARDFAPRLVAYWAGWGTIAIPGPRGCEWWIYILAPLVGGLLGAGLYEAMQKLNREMLPSAAPIKGGLRTA